VVSSSVWRRSLCGFGTLALLAMAVSGTAAAEMAIPAWAPGPFAAGDNTYDGFIDSPASGATVPADRPMLIRGWAVDRTAEGWAGVDDVHVYDGRAGEGGTFLGQALVAQSRPDVAAALGYPYWDASGFSMIVPGSTLLPGVRTLTVYAHTPDKGWWSREVTVNVAATLELPYPDDPLSVVIAPSRDASASTTGDYQIKGYSLDRNADPSQGTGVDRVQIYMDGPRGSAEALLLGEATLGQWLGSGADYGSQFARAGWDLIITPTQYASTSHTLYVYVRSSVSGKETLTTIPFKIVD
jgi:hypothetical protein